VADLKSQFTALHFVTSLPGITQPLFPLVGLSWVLCIQLLTNIIGLFQLALQDYGLPMSGAPSVPFLFNLDTLLQLVSSNDVCLSWSSAPRNYTVTTYKLLESMFLLYTRWYYCDKSTILGVEIIHLGPPASSTIQISPHVAFKQEVHGPLIELAMQWEEQAMASLDPAHHLSLYQSFNGTP
jgi:hypothetical protein